MHAKIRAATEKEVLQIGRMFTIIGQESQSKVIERSIMHSCMHQSTERKYS